MEIRLPELGGGSTEQQLRRLQSYLYTLASTLQVAFDGVSREQIRVREQISSVGKQQDTSESLAAVKSLIIRSAEITECMAEKLETRLAGRYVAQSRFGTFTRMTEQRIAAGAEELRQEFSNVQQIESDLAEIRNTLLEVSASIRTGLLGEDGSGPVYGVEIGQQERENGVVRFRKFARLTADRLSFYDSSGTEVACISDSRLHVTAAELADMTAQSADIRRLRMGDYLWEAGEDGHLSLR